MGRDLQQRLALIGRVGTRVNCRTNNAFECYTVCTANDLTRHWPGARGLAIHAPGVWLFTPWKQRLQWTMQWQWGRLVDLDELAVR